MSWILGFYGASLSHELRERLAALHEPPLHVIEDDLYYLATGGIEDTCHAGTGLDGTPYAWAVVGLGIRLEEDHCTFLDTTAWRSRLGPSVPHLDGLDGHFVTVRLTDRSLELFTDALGVRTVYLAEFEEGLAFSTRLDWLVRLRGCGDINLHAFGAHWLTFNQLTCTSLVRGIVRLGPGGRARFENGRLSIIETPWLPEIDEQDPSGQHFAETLAALIRPRLPSTRELSLGLSGGLDSRLLLAMRLVHGRTRTHVFGPSEHPDVQVAARIAGGEDLRHDEFHEPVPDIETCLVLLDRHVSQTQVVSSASAVLGLRYYPVLHTLGRCMIDGGLGEAARRQFMNRLLRRGRSALRKTDPAAMLPYLRVPRVDVFSPDVTSTMEHGALEQLDDLCRSLPAPARIGEENFVDLLGVQTRLPNFFGYEQNRLDAVILNYMPFAQPSLLRRVFQVPVRLRRNGKLFRRLIRRHGPSLAHYPLVKGGVTYPFVLPTLPAIVWTKVKMRLGVHYTDRLRLQFLDTVKPFVLDAVHSREVVECGLYDARRLQALVTAFYGGDESLAGQVDWWLAFEMWRRRLHAPGERQP